MEVVYTAKFDAQRKRYCFQFACEHCVHFNAATGGCIHGYPNHCHLLAYYDADAKPPTLIFCKEFDLG